MIEFKYVIGDGNGTFIRKDAQGNCIPVYQESLAKQFSSTKTASNYLKSNVNKNIRSRYKVLTVEIDTACDSEKSEKEQGIEIVKNTEYMKKISSEAIEPFETEPYSEEVENLIKSVESAKERKAALVMNLSDVDLEISDLNHYIEFGKFNVCEAYTTLMALQNRQRKRRQIKDEIYVLNQLGDCIVDEDMLRDAKEAIDKTNNRMYQPRKLIELFA